MRNTSTLILSLISFAVLFCTHSCKKDKEAEGTNKMLFDMAIENNGFVWYKNTDALLNKSSGSGHPQSFLRTRYNTIAAMMLDSTGKVKANAQFQEGSLIVKELLNDANTVERYAILYKKSDNQDADSKGWVWGYVNGDGTVAISASEKGNDCISCHSQNGNIDYMLMNKFFP